MTNSQRLANVRTALQHWLARHVETPAGEVVSDGLHRLGGESILIRGGFYCGRRFDAGTHHAVWFVEEDELKIYELSGKLVCRMQTADISHWITQTPPVAVQRAPDASEPIATATETVESSDERHDERHVLSMDAARSASAHGEPEANETETATPRLEKQTAPDRPAREQRDARSDQPSRRAA